LKAITTFKKLIIQFESNYNTTYTVRVGFCEGLMKSEMFGNRIGDLTFFLNNSVGALSHKVCLSLYKNITNK
jgi:hypothetical protein